MKVRTIRLAVIGVAAALALALPGLSGSAQSAEQADPPSLVLVNGRVVTMDRPAVARAVAVRDGRIVAVGSSASILRLVRDQTVVVNLRGRTVIPGFVDPHSHLFGDAERRGETLESIQQLALANGITAFANLGADADLLSRVRALASSGGLHLRTSLYPNYTTNCGEVLGHWYADDGPLTDPLAMLRVPGVKLFADGGSCGRPAVSYEYPPDGPSGGGMGDLYLTRDQVARAVSELEGMGFQAAIHALGDRALDEVLAGYDAALGGRSSALRHRIEHNAIVRPDQLPLYGRLGLVPTVFGAFGTCAFNEGGFARGDITPESAPWLWPTRAIVNSSRSLHVAWHGDWSVFDINPLVHFYGFVTRRQIGEDGRPCRPEPEQRNDTVTRHRALRMMTVEGAYALGLDGVTGSIRAGKLADLAVLSADPLTVPADRIPHIEVLATIVGGTGRHCATELSVVCAAG